MAAARWLFFPILLAWALDPAGLAAPASADKTQAQLSELKERGQG